MDYFHIALPADQLRTVSSIGLAHVGDGVYELLVRTWLCAHGKATVADAGGGRRIQARPQRRRPRYP